MRLILILSAVLTVVIVAAQAPAAILLLIVDGTAAILLLAAVTLAGTWVVPLLGFHESPGAQRHLAGLGDARVQGKPLPHGRGSETPDPLAPGGSGPPAPPQPRYVTHRGTRGVELSLRWRLLLGAGTGLGVLSFTVLLSGLAGRLDRFYWWVVLGLFAVVGVAAIGRITRVTTPVEPAPANDRFAWLWLMIVPFAAAVWLVCVIPPGFLWAEEGGGYDVLEYHLELPKEYFQTGRIAYTPHNVYGSFPANVEMLYLLCMILRGDPYAGAATANVLNALLAALFIFGAYVAGREVSARVGIASAVVAASTGWVTYLSGIAYVENGMLAFTMIGTACLLRAAGRSRDGERIGGWVVMAGLMAGFACGCKYSAALLAALPLGAGFAVLPDRDAMKRIGAVLLFAAAGLFTFTPWLVKNAALTGNPVFPLANTVFDARPDGWGPEETRHFDACHSLAPDESSLEARLDLLWRRIFADPDQRFGVVLFVLAAWRLVSPRRDRVDLTLAAMLMIQVVGWAGFTHLYARFAVPMVVPLVLLAGRAFQSAGRARPQRWLVVLLILGVAVNGTFVARTYARHLYHNGEELPLEGADVLFLNGLVSGHEHLAVINRDLPEDARVLMIGDAKAFYFQRHVDYCVVFNRNPFVEAVRRAADDGAIADWIVDSGYTHVLVNWSEVHRLRRSRYGFPREIQPALFDRLSGQGLQWMQTFASGDPPRAYAVLYRVER